MSAESQPILSGTELKTLKKLLDEMDYQESVAVGFALRYGDPEYATLHSNEEAALAISDARKARAAARLALEEYVELRTLTADETAVAKIAVTRLAQDVERLGHDDPDMHKALGTLQVKLSRSTYSRESVK